MAEKFRNKYRILSARLQSWDYGWNSAYFITICTHNRENFFGKILNGKMQLSEIGKIAHTYWHEIPNHFPFTTLGEFIAMPNHIHGIIIINKLANYANNRESGTVQTPKLGVSSAHPAHLEINSPAHPAHPEINPQPNPPAIAAAETSGENLKKSKSGGKNEQWKPGTLGVIINQYKRICTLNARKINTDFNWQTRFHDSIIRDEQAFKRISEYIKNNPTKWETDKFSQKSVK